MENDTWRTPPEVFAYFNADYDFKVDVCASKDNALCIDFIDEKENALKSAWYGTDGNTIFYNGHYVWCNPPYSNPLPFVKKAIEQSQAKGIGTALLLNHDMSTRWASILLVHKIEIIVFTKKRIAFLNEKGVPVKGNSKGQFVAIIPPYVREGNPDTTYVDLDFVMMQGGKYLEMEKAA
uniref:phage N-6-adenine-methyltransferase n=1 Tax=Ningiella ruwaisensis TaxID=2364274 RepID=UPI00109FF5DA|nr:phage N-6-adenine-methyltransferase [Ningiella ruwaisensis]